jgi:hypothetical protein
MMTTKRKRGRFVACFRECAAVSIADTSVIQIREGFIVDEDEEEEQEEDGGDSDGDVRHVVKRKRDRDRDQEEQLDEDDLELIGEQFGERPKPQAQVRWNRPFQELTSFRALTSSVVPVQAFKARPP